jgi:hypothetical protein
MEPEGSLPCSQEPSTGPCPESDQSSPYHSTPLWIVGNQFYMNPKMYV